MRISRVKKPPVEDQQVDTSNLPFLADTSPRKEPKAERRQPSNQKILDQIEELREPVLAATEEQVALVQAYLINQKSPFLAALKLAETDTTEILTSIFETKADVIPTTTRLYAIAQEAIHLQSIEFVATSLGLDSKQKRLLHLVCVSRAMAKSVPNDNLMSQLLQILNMPGPKEES